MSDIPVLLKGIEEPWIYPGFRGGGHGGPENLSSYNEEVELWPGSVVMKKAMLRFDIERQVEWEPEDEKTLRPFAYSMMINGYSPILQPELLRKTHPTMAEFIQSVEKINGFKFDGRDSDITWRQFNNSGQNIFVNWSKNVGGDKKIGVGVIQREPVPDLDTVLSEIVPYAVSIFNSLSPVRKISDEAVEKSIELARKSDKIIPVCRFK